MLILLSQRFVQNRVLIGKVFAVRTEVLLFQLTIFDISVVGQQQNGAGLPERRDDPLHQPGLERNILKENEIIYVKVVRLTILKGEKLKDGMHDGYDECKNEKVGVGL